MFCLGMGITERLVFTGILLLVVSALLVTADFRVPSKVEVHVGNTATLKCKLEGVYRWFLVSWIRRDPDGSEYTIVRLPSDTKTPEWDDGVDYEFRKRTKQKITIETELIEFNLVVRDVHCQDRGQYVCKYVGLETVQKVLQLSVKVDPLAPFIHLNYLVIKANSSQVIECQAQVGYPPRRLTWLYRPRGQNNFEVLPNNRPMQENKKTECDIYVVQPLEIFAMSNNTGVIYRCAYEGNYNAKDMFDEVSVHLPAVRVKEETETVGCHHTGSCALETIDERHDRSVSASLSANFVFYVCVSFVLLS